MYTQYWTTATTRKPISVLAVNAIKRTFQKEKYYFLNWSQLQTIWILLHVFTGKKLSDLERVTSLKVYNWFANRRKEIKRRANIGNVSERLLSLLKQSWTLYLLWEHLQLELQVLMTLTFKPNKNCPYVFLCVLKN